MNTLCIPLVSVFFVIVAIIVSMNNHNNSSANSRDDIDPYDDDQLVEDIVQLDMIDNEWEDDR